MKFGIENIREMAEFISYIVTSMTLIGLFITYILSKKQIHFSAMEKCIRDYREFIKQPQSLNDESIVEQYFDLVNEEFFYFENSYIPIEVSIEWIDGMIDYLPFFNNSEKYEKSKRFLLLDNPEITLRLLINYPRIYKVIQLRSSINFEKIHWKINNEENREIRRKERDKLIFLMISNLKMNSWKMRRIKSKIANR
jgi:hypothetical protein